MKWLIAMSLVGLLFVPAARAGDDKKNGDEKPFKVQGKLTEDDPPDAKTNKPHKVHEYKMKAGETYQIDLVSPNTKVYDPYLRIENSAKENLAEDDDSGGNLNARITFKAPKDDTYRLIVTAFHGVGSYTLTVQRPSKAAAEFQAIKDRFESKQKELFKEFGTAKTDEERDAIRARFFEMTAESLAPLSEFAQKYAEDPAAREARRMVQNSLRMVEQAESPAVGKVLRNLVENGPKELRGEAGLALSQNLRMQYEKAYQKKTKDAGKLLEQARSFLKKVGENYPDLAERVKDIDFAFQHLTVGRPAMEIEAEDLDGKKFKLSDYRGKVVVLDFWGNW